MKQYVLCGRKTVEPQDKNYTKFGVCQPGFGARQTVREPVLQQAFLLAKFWRLEKRRPCTDIILEGRGGIIAEQLSS